MGCQASKAVTAPKAGFTATPQSPTTKTLLEGADASKKAHIDAHTTASSIGDSAPAASTVAGSSVQLPSASPTATNQAASSARGSQPVGGDLTDGTHSLGTQSLGVSSHGTARHGTHSHGLLRKQGTLCTQRNELDIMVVEFSSHDSTLGSAIGRNCKEMKWRVMHDRGVAPIDIKLHVQEHNLHNNEVNVESNGQSIFAAGGSHAKAIDDFHYQWPFRAAIRGINEANFFEVHPPHCSTDVWCPATITSQRDDGCFEVHSQELDANGVVVVMTYPAVHKNNLREASSKKPLYVPEDCLTLDVPKQNPLHATLRLGNGELVTHHFGRPSPPPSIMAELSLSVSKDRSKVIANVGHSTLSHFVSGEVRSTRCEAERLQHSWTIQAGPFAEHTVQVMKRHTLGKIVTLLVDGEVLVEASAADIGCQDREWHCQFRFIGERVLDFEVHKTNSEGAALDQTAHVKEIRKYVHECHVVIPNDHDFTTAQLFLDGAAFTELPMAPQPHEEPHLTMEPLALLHSYGISTPYKVDQEAPSNLSSLANHIYEKACDAGKLLGLQKSSEEAATLEHPVGSRKTKTEGSFWACSCE